MHRLRVRPGVLLAAAALLPLVAAHVFAFRAFAFRAASPALAVVLVIAVILVHTLAAKRILRRKHHDDA